MYVRPRGLQGQWGRQVSRQVVAVSRQVVAVMRQLVAVMRLFDDDDDEQCISRWGPRGGRQERSNCPPPTTHTALRPAPQTPTTRLINPGAATK